MKENRLQLSIGLCMLLILISLSLSSCGSSTYSWNIQYKVAGYGLFGISMTDTDNGWAIGQKGFEDNAILSFDGSSWSTQKRMGEWLHAISASDREHAWAVGNSADHLGGVVYFCNGSDWEKQYDAEEDLNVVFALNKENVWAGGRNGGIYFYDGNSWQTQFKAEIDMRGIFATSEEDVWAIGKYVYHFDGSSWERDDGLLDAINRDGGLLSPYHITAAEGKIWVTVSDNIKKSAIYCSDGTSWKKQYEGELILQDIEAFDKNHVWAAGVTFDKDLSAISHLLFCNGTNWNTEQTMNGEFITGLSALDENQIWASGNTSGGGGIYLGTR